MEIRPTSIPFDRLPLSIQLFEREIIFALCIILSISIWWAYKNWRKMENESRIVESEAPPTPQFSRSDRLRAFRARIESIPLEDSKFYTKLEIIVREFLLEIYSIQLEPTKTVSEYGNIPEDARSLLIALRDARYAQEMNLSTNGMPRRSEIRERVLTFMI